MKGGSTGAAKHVVDCYRERKGLRVEGRGQGGGAERRTERERARSGRRVSQEMMMEQYARAGQRRSRRMRERDRLCRKKTDKGLNKAEVEAKNEKRREGTHMRHAAQRPHAAS